MSSLLAAVAQVVRLVDFLTADLVQLIRRRLTSALSGPLLELVVGIVIGLTGVVVIVERVAGWIDRAAAWLERGFVAIALLAMTALAFNAYLAEELRQWFNDLLGGEGPAQDLFGLWAIDGQLNFALLLMVVVGFLGASLATQEGKHIAVDAAERVLSPPGARWVRRFAAFVAGGLCFLLAQGSVDAMLTHTQDKFEGAKVWSPLVAPVNGLTALMDGDKFGPASCRDLDESGRAEQGCPEVDFASSDDWIGGMWDMNHDPNETHFEDAKVSLANDGETEVKATLVAAASSVEEATRWDVTVAPGDKTMFETVSLEHGARAWLTWDGREPVPVMLESSQLHTVTMSSDGVTVKRRLPIAYGYVDAGDDFPLWIPFGFLVVAFTIMGLRFFARVLAPGSDLAQAPPVVGSRRVADVVLAGAVPGALLAIGAGVWLGQGWIIGIASLMLVVLGAPLFVGIGVGTVASWVLLRDGSAESVVSDMFEAVKKQELLAIPFFVLAGNLMTRGSIAERLIGLAKAVLGPLPGGLGAGAVLACATFAAISGSSPVTVIAIGSIMFPMLLKEGYSERYSMGVLTTAGGLGVIIPPSIPMIIYAIMVSGNSDVGVVTPTDLFRAGMLPGLFIALVLIAYTMFVHWPRPDEIDDQPTTEFTFSGWLSELGRAIWLGIPSLMLPVLILGGLYGWLNFGFVNIVFDVTTASAVAVVYALFVEMFVHRELKWSKIPEVFSESAVMMGSLFLILVIAISLNKFFVFEEVPQAAAAWMLERVQTPFGFLVMVNLFLLALGCVMDILSAILIVAPLLAPIATGVYGIDPIAFGIMFIVNLELGYLTPPMGINLFVASTTFERSIIDVIRGVLPFLLLMVFCLVCIVAYVWFTSTGVTP